MRFGQTKLPFLRAGKPNEIVVDCRALIRKISAVGTA
jgi:hypothetical protein